MDELVEVLNQLRLNHPKDDNISYEYINVFKNPSKLPINQIHLEKTVLKVRKDITLDALIAQNDFDETKCFERKTVIIPALDKCWLPESQIYFRYEPYNFTLSKEENVQFLNQNLLFLQTLNYLLSCNYHQFWCSVLYETEIIQSLHSFILNPILPHQIEQLDEDYVPICLSVLTQFLKVYDRLTTFQQSEYEYLPEDVGMQFLLDKKLINLPILLTLALLYQELDQKFINNLVELYFLQDSLFRDKEIEEMLTHVIMTLEMIGGHVCGFEQGAVIVPLAIEPRPKIFSVSWVYSVVDYLFNTISTLHILLKFHKPAVEKALMKNMPYRLSFTYERVFYSLYDLIEQQGLEPTDTLVAVILDEISLARSEFIDVYHLFISHCLDKTLEFSGDHVRQQEFVEIYLKLLTTAMEDEYFICDYHERYDVKAQNELFASCCEIDETRTDYVVNCITNSKRYSRIWKTLKCDKKTMEKAIRKYTEFKRRKVDLAQVADEGATGPSAPIPEINYTPSEEEIENLIKIVIDMFPHLGDGFVLQCLEAYNYQANDVIGAILEENLPPHIVDIPFDLPRIPPEPKPVEPILAYRGHKPDYDDALKLLNDKKDMKQIKTFILDGIQYTNKYDVYDDEYDDRLDEETVNVPDHGSEDILRFNPNYEDAVSDTSYSENEYDDKGQPVAVAVSNDRNKANFCEDPAVVRARREARRRAQGKPSQDVVGKPKGQGQDQKVLNNRQKKAVHKSSRANHNRKSGAQWKRNKGMLPS